MTEKVLYVILTTQIWLPKIVLEQILNLKANSKLLQSENGKRFQKNDYRFKIRAID